MPFYMHSENGCVCKQCALPSVSGDVRWQDGKVSGTVYSGEEKLTHLLVKVKCKQSNFADIISIFRVTRNLSTLFRHISK